MERTYINTLSGLEGEEVQVKGFAQAIRDQSKIVFIVVRDITGLVQCVVKANSPMFEMAKSITTESVVSVTGVVKKEEQAPGGYEISVEALEILSLSATELPIPVVDLKGASKVHQDIRYDYRWLDLRREENAKIFKVWTALETGFRKYWAEEKFLQIYSPAFMSTASETGSEVFEVNYFDRKAYLAQSPQFYKQMAMASGFERIFTVGSIFRAEESFTTRHMTEFTGWDFEVSYIDSYTDIMDHHEKMLVAGFSKVKDAFPELAIEVPETPFPRITMQEAKKKLADAGIESKEDHDVSPEEEREIFRIIKEETGNDFVFLTDYHISKRPFYHMRHEDNPELTKSMDLLYRGIEITTMAQREHRSNILEAQAKEKGMNLNELAGYIDFFRYGCPPHGGGGIGPARIIMKILDLPNVRDATFLPRDVKRLNP
jgi:aspartyl-tRNA synthetase